MREYNALCKRRRANEEHATYRAAFIVSSIYHVNRAKGHDPIRPADFMAGKKKPKQTPEQMLANMKSLALMVGGKLPEV